MRAKCKHDKYARWAKTSSKNRNIGDYENKSKEDLIKVLSKPKPKIRINKKKLEEIRKDFSELRHKFSKKEIDTYRKSFYGIKNYRHLSTSEIKEARKNVMKLKKSLKLKKFHGNVDSVDYDDLDNCDDNYDFADDDEYRKIGSIKRLFVGFDRDYYKPIQTNDSFDGKKIVAWNIQAEEIDMKIYHQKSILIWLDHI